MTTSMTIAQLLRLDCICGYSVPPSEIELTLGGTLITWDCPVCSAESSVVATGLREAA